MKLSLALALAATAGYASAMCPNSCSGHGECLSNDECTCYPSFSGNDCSERVCPTHTAWVTTSNGDVNSDGDQLDATSHSDAISASNLPTYFTHYTAGTGIFESWPAHKKAAHSGLDEGHYQMACSNQGLCDTKTGMCQCFEGYEGVACRRSTCPNSCSNAGVCRTVRQIGAKLSKHTHASWSANQDPATEEATTTVETNGALAYKFWDKDMSQACVCDSGYSGADCSERQCALGDDPLTLGQHAETQFLEISAEVEFAGSATISYTDTFGAVWTTASFATAHYDEGTTAVSRTVLKNAAQNAITGLPGNMLAGTTVSIGYCEQTLPGFHKHTIAADGGGSAYCGGTFAASTNQPVHTTAAGAPTAPTADYYRVQGQSPIYDATTNIAVAGYTCDSSDYGDSDDVQIYTLSHKYCIRYEVFFGGRSGDVAELSIDTSNVIAKTGQVVVTATGHSTTLTSGAFAVASMTGITGAPNEHLSVYDVVHVVVDGYSYGLMTTTAVSGTSFAATSSISRDAAAITTGSVTIEQTSIHGRTASFNNVATTAVDSLALGTLEVFSPKVAACTGAEGTACDGYAVMCKHDAVTGEDTNTDAASGGNIALSGGDSVLTCVTAKAFAGDGTTSITDFTTILGYGDEVKVYCGSTGNLASLGTYKIKSTTGVTVTFAEAVPTCNTDYYTDAAHSAQAARNANIYLERKNWIVRTDVDLLTADLVLTDKTITIGTGASMKTCDVQNVLADSGSATTGSRIICSNTAGASAEIATSAQAVVVSGKGTTEAAPCSDRGLCNTETGLCECFAGYSGIACSSQNALSA